MGKNNDAGDDLKQVKAEGSESAERLVEGSRREGGASPSELERGMKAAAGENWKTTVPDQAKIDAETKTLVEQIKTGSPEAAKGIVAASDKKCNAVKAYMEGLNTGIATVLANAAMQEKFQLEQRLNS